MARDRNGNDDGGGDEAEGDEGFHPNLSAACSW